LISAALLLGANAAAGVEEQNRATEAPTSPAKESQVAGADKNVFEVKLNVSDYKPEELIVKILNGVVTIEGKHEETKTHKGEEGKEDGPKELVSTHFKEKLHYPEEGNRRKAGVQAHGGWASRCVGTTQSHRTSAGAACNQIYSHQRGGGSNGDWHWH